MPSLAKKRAGVLAQLKQRPPLDTDLTNIFMAYY